MNYLIHSVALSAWRRLAASAAFCFASGSFGIRALVKTHRCNASTARRLAGRTLAVIFVGCAALSGNRRARLLIVFGVFVLGAVPAAVQAADDYPANTTTTGTVAVGGSQTGALQGRGDVDWIKVTLVGGTGYVIDYQGSATGQGTLWDPYFRGVYDSNGDLISGTTNDNGGHGHNSRVDFTPSSSGTYFLGLGTTSPSLTGTYRVSVTESDDYVIECVVAGDDYENDTTITGSVSVGGSAVGTRQRASDCMDHDWFSVAFDAGKTYRVDIRGSWTNHGSLRDTRIAGIYDSNGDLIKGTEDDNSGVDKEARAIFTAPTTGTYYISATGGEFPFPAEDSGTYTVKVAEVGADDYAANTATSGSVAVDGSTTGTIERPGDRDWLGVTLETGNWYQFDFEGIGEDWPLLGDRFIQGIYDSDGDGLAGTYTPESREGEVQAIFEWRPNDGTYYIAVGARKSFSGTGEYRLSVTNLGPSPPGDLPGDVSTRGSVDVGGSIAGELEEAGDRDWFKVTLEVGKTYRFDLEGSSTNRGTLGDPYLHGIRDSGGNLIWGTPDNNSGIGQNSRVYFTPDSGGTYYVAVGALFGRVGTYRLSATEEEIADEEGLTLSVSDASRAESAGSIGFVVTLSRAASALVTVDYSTRDGTATAGEDYAATSRNLVFPAGRTAISVWVPLIDDDEEDSGETFTLELSNARGATLSDGTATGTILNSENFTATFPASAYASASHSGAEDRPQVVVEFSAAVASIAASTPSVTVAGGSVSGVQRHPREAMENARLFFVDPSGDGDVVFTLSADEPCYAGGICTAHGTRLMAVPGPRTIPGPGGAGPTLSVAGAIEFTASVSVADAIASEGDAIEFTVSLSAASDQQVTVEYETTGVTATSGTDFTDTSGTVEFTAGETSKTVSVPTTEDSADEEDETLTLTLSSPSNATLDNVTATGTIEDDDEPVPGTLSVADAEASEEEDSTLDFVVTLDPAATATVTVDYATADGTATAGSDYTATSGTLTFQPGDTSKTVSVPITNDSLDDGGETLTLTLSGASGADLGDAEATGTIRNTEPSELSVADAEASEEEDSTLDFVVTLDPAATATVTVDYATADGTATAGSDYTATSGTLTFQSGDTSKTVSVPITNDSVDDGGETLTLTLSSASGADLGDAVATGTIRNTELVPLTASFEDVPAEHDGSTVFTFRLRFSEDPAVSYTVLRDKAFSVSGGKVEKARRVDGRHDLREIHVKPETTGEIRIDLPATSDCEAANAICTADDRPLSHSLSTTVQGPGSEQSGFPLDPENSSPSGIWSDGETAWVAQWLGDTVRAYRLSDGQRVAGRDIELAGGNLLPGGVWADGETLWVADWRRRMYAYRLSDGEREPGRDIVSKAADADPTGLWSGGRTLLSTSWEDGEVRAFRLPTASPRTAIAGQDSAPAAGLLTLADPALRAAVAAALGKAPEDAVTADDLAGLEVLNARNGGIRDLSGLEALVSLKELDLGFNPVADLQPVAALPELESLNLDGAAPELRTLMAVPSLKRLSLRQNGIDDLQPLAPLTGLNELDVGDNRIGDLQPLAGLFNLTVLRADRNRIADLSPLASLAALEALDLGANQVRDLHPLVSMTQLRTLRLGGNGLTNLYPLSGLEGLRELGLADNAVDDLGALPNLGGLRRLDLSGNAVSDLQPLRTMPSLVWVNVSGSPIKDLAPLDSLPGLTVAGPDDRESRSVLGEPSGSASQQ